MRKTTRTGEVPENNFTEVSQGEVRPSVEVSVNAKGMYQYTLKLYYDTNEDVLARASEDAEAFDKAFRVRFPVPRP